MTKGPTHHDYQRLADVPGRRCAHGQQRATMGATLILMDVLVMVGYAVLALTSFNRA